jgi:hypothetical protein
LKAKNKNKSKEEEGRACEPLVSAVSAMHLHLRMRYKALGSRDASKAGPDLPAHKCSPQCVAGDLEPRKKLASPAPPRPHLSQFYLHV